MVEPSNNKDAPMFTLYPDVVSVENSNAYEFLSQNSDLSLRSPNGLCIELIDSIGYVELHLRIDPNTTISSIKSSGKWLLEWRDRVHNWNKQRLSIIWDEEERELRLFKYLNHLHQIEGMSYQKIAEKFNEEIVDLIKNFLILEEEYRQEAKFSTKDEYGEWRRKVMSQRGQTLFAYEDVRLILRTIGIDDRETNIWIEEIVNELKGQKRRFLTKDEPVTREKVRNWLEYRRKTIGNDM